MIATTATTGIEPMLRAPMASNDSALLLTLMVIFAANLLLAPTLIRAVRVFRKQLFRTHRESIPGEKTLGERLVMVSGIIQTLIFEALLLYCACGADRMPPLAALAGLLLLTITLFLVQYCGYSLTGYAFTSGENLRMWLYAFFITQACAGFALAIPAMGALFYPHYLNTFLLGGVVIYILCRIPLFIRELRIFYTSPASLFYFFLYLCTLEIVPFIGVIAFANFFSSLFCQ